LDVRVFFGQRQHFVLDEFRIGAVDRVVFEAAFAPLRILPAGADADCDDRRDAMLLDEIVEDGKELLFVGVAAVAKDNEWSFASGCVVSGNIDIDGAGPDSRVGSGNKKVRLIAGRRLRGVNRGIETTVRIIPDHAGIEARAVIRRYGEGIDLARGRSVVSGRLWRGGVRRPDDEIAFRLD